ncbi:putative transcriptional regulatory protein TcrX [Arthrobacter sp. Bi83]|jgi:two-component system OmpR family response regulator|uniref:winged helix-turn-helix domain-containing protein n=1 Tax=Arthrobacter sp. Bi83 TaxID=2822353 RepID=UPI001DC9278B|nr:winged helix-turn-helix domain-containing protein [Arthrobacter sp. Bi83]CAH0204303.1 putative transcriptional regulatory protein TcrX [Arthrobacter sp. Bi83]
MAVHAHTPRGNPAGGSVGGRPHLTAVPDRNSGAPGFKARGLAVWVTAGPGQDIDEAVLTRAAELVLARALKIAPEAEVHWPAAGAATSAAGSFPSGKPPGEGAPHGTPDGGTPAPLSSSPEDSPQLDDGGAPHLPPSGGPVSRVAVDLAKGEVLLDGRPVPLTGVEFKLLRYLVENCSRAIGREELRVFLESFDSPGAATRSIDVYVGRVRRKLRGGRHAIATVRGGGYQFIPGPGATVRGPAEYSI